jgi:hypothetical protein
MVLGFSGPEYWRRAQGIIAWRPVGFGGPGGRPVLGCVYHRQQQVNMLETTAKPGVQLNSRDAGLSRLMSGVDQYFFYLADVSAAADRHP